MLRGIGERGLPRPLEPAVRPVRQVEPGLVRLLPGQQDARRLQDAGRVGQQVIEQRVRVLERAARPGGDLQHLAAQPLLKVHLPPLDPLPDPRYIERYKGIIAIGKWISHPPF